ncbi:uncharacterized protein LOC103487477 isoform X1 [Cucumis melo]|uniref:Uncharacterized protein LOC103487477 isoform X1 n=2 Tax=Cucumis melo TaxID=3656 RepID=A0ABM3KHZ8_CUCME|nr:uncharacterized protein LOC103487477 isoform X1 [Cucumis melo]
MLFKLPSTYLKPSTAGLDPSISLRADKLIFGCFTRNVPERKYRFKLVGLSMGDKWPLNDIDANAVQQNLNKWLLKTQNFLNEVTSPREKTSKNKNHIPAGAYGTTEKEDIVKVECTVNIRTPNGLLSSAAVVSIEQFSRMNGLTGQKMQRIFKALVHESVYNDARSLVEYCCFRFLSRDSSNIHPSLSEPTFQRLIFITMLAWENPYHDHASVSEEISFQKMLVREEAFTRIAPAISGVADRSTVHNLFKALAGDKESISLSLWLKYVDELIRVHEGRKLYRVRDNTQFFGENILCIGSSKKRPVLKWENNIAWPGKLTLTDKAVYFEAVGIFGQKDIMRLDLTKDGVQVDKAKVGPFGSILFDSAVSVSSSSEMKTWVLEFVDLGGEMRRDVWYAFISEVVASHQFIREYGPEDDDESCFHVYGAHKGKERAMANATNGIARLQALQFMRKLLDDPIKLVMFSFLQNAPYGDVVCQTLAVNIWGGPLMTNFLLEENQAVQIARSSDEVYEGGHHIFDIDGSVYLRNWMRSPSWNTSTSISFWKNPSMKEGVILSKNLVVAGMSLVERAAETCNQRYHVAEKTQATIDSAMIKGIPSNIDLFKELLLPVTMIAKTFEKLRRWEQPHLSISFLAVSYTIIFRNLLSFVFPTTLLMVAAGMLTLKGLKEQGRLGRSFGKVTIRDQPPSNTIQKIMAVKDAMRDVENFLQNLNVSLLKIRTIVLAGQTQITTEVALVLLASAIILLIVPFNYVLSVLIFDLFTRELQFRQETVKRFMKFLRERWDSVPASPVVVLPFDNNELKSSSTEQKEAEQQQKPKA